MKSVRYSLPNLPYDYNALSPVISEEIMRLHHDKHHLAYVNGANNAMELLEKARKGVVQIDYKGAMKNLSFHLNGHMLHNIFWENMRPQRENNMPEGKLLELIVEQFGSYEAFVNEYTQTGLTVEGSGWVILYVDENMNLLIGQAEKHNLLSYTTHIPVLVNDVWEHAYYLDYKNDRGAYLKNWWSIVNWDDVSVRVFGE